ncbi:MAG: hypothetical protein EP340_08165 [Alphaproteobacteria bacterium]|nr:MAG: hypothetical protein EP340_08165 [Alphaproteobacteria bacterium]
MRFLILELLLLATPFIIYRLYLRYVIRHKAESGMGWNEAPVTWLMIAGFVLAILGVLYWGLEGGSSSKGPYTPATLEDGILKPGSIGETPEEDK